MQQGSTWEVWERSDIERRPSCMMPGPSSARPAPWMCSCMCLSGPCMWPCPWPW